MIKTHPLTFKPFFCITRLSLMQFHSQNRRQHLILSLALALISLLTNACMSAAGSSEFFGKVEPPADNTLRYISGSEPESLDPQVGTGQPEARLYMALYEGLAEYDPKTMEPIPAIAELWEVNGDSSEFVFHLRRDARFSDGTPITARDFVYTFRRGLSPELAARNAYLAYYIKYAQAYNEGGVFVRDARSGEFLLEQDVKPEAAKGGEAAGESAVPETEFHRFMHSPTRLVLPGDEKKREKMLGADAKLKAAVEGKELVPVKGEDMGVEAVDDYTFRMTLTQSAPFFVKLIPHQFFRVVPRHVIEKYGNAGWPQPGRIVTSGAYRLLRHKPYNEVVVERDPMYWDARNVKLDRIYFYPLEEQTTMMNLYKTGAVDATYNHTVPVAWLDVIRPLKDYMDAPEVAIQYYLINVTKPPMNDIRVRKAFNMAIDKKALSEWRRVTKPLTAFTPEGIFPGYPQPKGDEFNPTRAKQLLAEAGYRDAAGNFAPLKFPTDQVELTYNTNDSNRQVAEFIQAQWKQNLEITVPLKSMESKTFLDHRSKIEYRGFARSGYAGDYLDPFTFLNLFSTEAGDNGTGWSDAKYVQMLDEANRTLDPKKRYELLAKAEAYLLAAQPFIPLYTNATNWMKKPYVKGMYPNPGTLHAWKFVYIERDSAKWDRGVPSMVD